MMKIGTIIKRLRQEKNWTQEQLAEALHVKQHTISQWETGNRLIDLQTLEQLLNLTNARLRIENVSDITQQSWSFKIEPTHYTEDEIRLSMVLLEKQINESEVYEVSLERNGLRLILPEFFFGRHVPQVEREEDVYKALAFDYALYEDCPTFVEYLANRGLTHPTEQESLYYRQLQWDMSCALAFFTVEELQNMHP